MMWFAVGIIVCVLIGIGIGCTMLSSRLSRWEEGLDR